MTNDKQQTAVDWLLDRIEDVDLTEKLWENIKHQAKEKEKNQHSNTWNNAINAVEKDKWESFEDYYEQTYGGNK
jgi:hypothetical protein